MNTFSAENAEMDVLCTKEEVKKHQLICKFNDNLMSGCDKGCDAIIKGNQINSHNCANYLKDIIDEKNRGLTKSYHQIHSQKLSFEKRIDELITQKRYDLCRVGIDYRSKISRIERKKITE